MNNTQIAAIFTAFINFVVALLSNLGVITLSPETVASLNGFLLPLILTFMGNKVDEVKEKAAQAANTAARVEAAQPTSSTRVS